MYLIVNRTTKQILETADTNRSADAAMLRQRERFPKDLIEIINMSYDN